MDKAVGRTTVEGFYAKLILEGFAPINFMWAYELFLLPLIAPIKNTVLLFDQSVIRPHALQREKHRINFYYSR
jgi:hypothetical protein